jgi:hypothetical protein
MEAPSRGPPHLCQPPGCDRNMWWWPDVLAKNVVTLPETCGLFSIFDKTNPCSRAMDQSPPSKRISRAADARGCLDYR